MNPKTHISLDVTNLERSLTFYSTLFGMPPTKVKPGYAKFDVAEPGLVLALQEKKGFCDCICGLNHLGIRVASTEQVLAVRARLQAAGLATFDEMNTTCCYAVQDKIWVTDPSGYKWETYVFKGDSATEYEKHDPAVCACGDEKTACCS